MIPEAFGVRILGAKDIAESHLPFAAVRRKGQEIIRPRHDGEQTGRK